MRLVGGHVELVAREDRRRFPPLSSRRRKMTRRSGRVYRRYEAELPDLFHLEDKQRASRVSPPMPTVLRRR